MSKQAMCNGKAASRCKTRTQSTKINGESQVYSLLLFESDPPNIHLQAPLLYSRVSSTYPNDEPPLCQPKTP